MEIENESTTEDVGPETDSQEEKDLSTEQEQQNESDAVALELDSASKFKWKGKEYTLKDLDSWHSGHLRQQDYTKKTQEIAKERKFYDNLSYDLEYVKSNPLSANQFKSVYPEKFHKFLDYVLKKEAEKNGEQAETKSDPKYEALMEKINFLESDFKERRMSAINSQLDSMFEVLSKKYPYADEEMVLARASSLLEKEGSLDDKAWDSLWKSVHERNKSLLDKHYSAKVKEQTTANQKGKDVPGGGALSPGGKQFKTIKEAGNHFNLDDLM